MSSAGRDIRQQCLGLVFLGAALLLNFHFFTLGWDNTLLGYHQFRQVQTAIASYHYLRDGLSVHYITPLLGPPWEVPLEFPLYQLSAALCARGTALDLDAAARLTSWLYFLGVLPACYLLLERFRLTAAQRLLFPALLLLSPLYLFYSRAVLIESTALFTACWFLLCFERFLRRPGPGWLAGAMVFGSLAGMIKGTTFAVFLIVALFFLCGALRAPGQMLRRQVLLRAALLVALPFLAMIGWVFYSARIRHLNPDAQFLDGIFGYWSFGDLAQRLSWSFWSKTFRVWADEIAGEGGLLLLAFYFIMGRGQYRRTVLVCLAAFLSGQLIFTNLYWVHDYYFYANSLFLVAALGFSLIGLLNQLELPEWKQWLVVTAVMGLQISTFDRTFLDAQKKNVPIPPVTELVRTISEPDDIIVVFGQDWDAALPYYSGRKALMFLTGREADPESMRRSIARLDPHKVAAVIMAGFHWRDGDLINRTMSALNLGSRPFLYDMTGTGVWVPVERQAALRDRFNPSVFPDFTISPVEHVPNQGIVLLARQIRRRSEFDCFSPRPIRAFATHDFTYITVSFQRMLVANSTTELTFALPVKATQLTAIYGLSDDAYTNGHTSDGIELTVTLRPAQGQEQRLYYRYLNPRANEADRGPQKLAVALPPGATGELIVRLLPGPAGDASYDWSYIGQGTIR